MTKKIPKFPKFRPFTVKDTGWYYNYYINQRLNPYADIHPENMLTWLNINDDLMISSLDNDILIKYTNVLDNNNLNIIPLSNPIKSSSIKSIMSYLSDHGLPMKLCEVPSIICHGLDETEWLIDNDRNSYEYILDTSKQSLLEGKNFSDQRRRIRFFEKEHSKDVVDIQYYKKMDRYIKKAFLKYLKDMPTNNNAESSRQNINEPLAIKNSIKYASAFDKNVMIIKINGKIVSLSMVSNLDRKTAGGNHLKVDYSIKYIFHYTVYQLSKTLLKDGVKEINIEQDLGIEGIRNFKMHLPPSRFLEKVTIRPRQE